MERRICTKLVTLAFRPCYERISCSSFHDLSFTNFADALFNENVSKYGPESDQIRCFFATRSGGICIESGLSRFGNQSTAYVRSSALLEVKRVTRFSEHMRPYLVVFVQTCLNVVTLLRGRRTLDQREGRRLLQHLAREDLQNQGEARKAKNMERIP